MNWKSTGWKFLLVVFSIAYGVVMLGLNGMPISDLYSTSPYHRYQALALLHGHFYLSDSIYAIQPGLAWHNGQVHQVWGLGVGIWLLPFQAAWSLFGGGVFPDRIALAAAFALLGYYSIITGIS